MTKLSFVNFLSLLIFCLIYVVHIVDSQYGVTHYSFTRYSYKKKPQNEKKIRNQRERCEADEACAGKSGLDLTNCARNCMSPKCYGILYKHDELEEGEIDVRFNSFKGCVLDELKKQQK